MTQSILPLDKPTGLLRNPIVRTGLLTGVLLSAVMATTLVLANRMPKLEYFARERNALCSAVFVIIAMLPMARFRRSPLQLFASGIIGWVVVTLAYVAAGNYFSSLQRIWTPGVVLAYGALFYGLAALAFWVLAMVRSAVRVRPSAPRRRPRHLHHSQ